MQVASHPHHLPWHPDSQSVGAAGKYGGHLSRQTLPVAKREDTSLPRPLLVPMGPGDNMQSELMNYVKGPKRSEVRIQSYLMDSITYALWVGMGILLFKNPEKSSLPSFHSR